MGKIGNQELLLHSSLYVWMDVCEKLKPMMFASWLFSRNFCLEWDWKQSNKKYLFHNITMGIISVFFQKTSIKICHNVRRGRNVLANPNFKWESKSKTLLLFSAFVPKPPSPKCPFPLPPYQPAAFWISMLEKLLVAFENPELCFRCVVKATDPQRRKMLSIHSSFSPPQPPASCATIHYEIRYSTSDPQFATKFNPLHPDIK